MKGFRPVVNKMRSTQFCEVYGAVEPAAGEFFYKTIPPKEPVKKKMGRPKKGEIADSHKKEPKEKGQKSRQFNDFMQKLCDKYPDDHIMAIGDRAWHHNSQYTVIPDNLTLLFIPPATPEMNPIEQLWREIKTSGFHNNYFKTIQETEAQIHATISALPIEKIMSITQRSWIMNMLNSESV